MANPSSQRIQILTFTTPDDIWKHEKFRSNNPVSEKNYKRLFGDYNFDVKVECCYLKDNGNLCKHEHNRGWVVELNDETITIIGNKCALDKFNADPKFISHHSLYINEKKRQERLASLATLLEQKTQRLEHLAEIRKHLDGIESSINVFTKQLGPQVQHKLLSMFRSRTTEVTVRAVRNVEYIEYGRTKYERRTFSQVIGRLYGLALVSPVTFESLTSRIGRVLHAYEKAENSNSVLKSKEVDLLATHLGDYEHIIRDAENITKMKNDFFSNNWLSLCFLVDDKAERAKAARVAMRSSTMSGQKIEPMDWLREQEKLVKEQLGIDSIEIR